MADLVVALLGVYGLVRVLEGFPWYGLLAIGAILFIWRQAKKGNYRERI